MSPSAPPDAKGAKPKAPDAKGPAQGAAKAEGAPAKKRKRRPLVFRLYLASFIQLVLLAGAVLGVGFIVRHAMPPPEYEAHGWGPPPEGPGEHPDEAHPPHPEGPRDHHHGHPQPGPWAPLATFFVSGILIVAVGGYLNSRWLTRPLARLADTARALGEGDLRARTGIVRNDEIGEVAESFDEMAARVQKLVLAEKELLANVSHELRTPLARIGVHLELASEGDAETTRASLGEIAVDLAELVKIIDDILTTTRFELSEGRAPEARLPLHRVPMTPDEIARRAEDRFRAHHPARPLDVQAPPGLPEISVDAVLFRRVLDNLLENAHRYTPDPKRVVHLRAFHDERAKEIVFTVEDEGIGVGAEDLPRLFTPFYRTDRSRSRTSGGVGLGLTLSRRIVEAHGGTIAFGSRIGAGTTVRVRIPIEPRPETIRNPGA